MTIGDMFAWGLSWMDEQLVDHGSQTITYYQDGAEVRGPDDADIVATHGANVHEAEDLGIVLETDSADWLISTTMLPANFVPRRGDTIVATIQGVEMTFEVMVSGEAEFRRSDTYGNRLRIHSKRIDSYAT